MLHNILNKNEVTCITYIVNKHNIHTTNWTTTENTRNIFFSAVSMLWKIPNHISFKFILVIFWIDFKLRRKKLPSFKYIKSLQTNNIINCNNTLMHALYQQKLSKHNLTLIRLKYIKWYSTSVCLLRWFPKHPLLYKHKIIANYNGN